MPVSCPCRLRRPRFPASRRPDASFPSSARPRAAPGPSRLPSILSFLLLLFLIAPARAISLRPDDLLFFSTHLRPSQVVSDSRLAFLLTESGILVYDYRRSAYLENLVPPGPVQALAASSKSGRLRIVAGGQAFEYHPTFRRFEPAAGLHDPQDIPSGRNLPVSGAMLEGGYFLTGESIRDKQMRQAPVVQSRVFDYDNWWILTDGLGPFLGSERRRSLKSLYFGLDQPAQATVFAAGGNLWFGGVRKDAGLVRAREDLSQWSRFPPLVEPDFQSGSIRAMAEWKGFLWLATSQGITRFDPRSSRFKAYRRFHGSTDLETYALAVQDQALLAGTQYGLSRLANPDGEFEPVALPGSSELRVLSLDAQGRRLAVGTGVGLILQRDGRWEGEEQAASYGLPIRSAVLRDSTVFYTQEGRVFRRTGSAKPQVLLEREEPFRLQVQGDLLYVGFRFGLTAYHLRSGQWTDFRLEDGIRGGELYGFLAQKDRLWFATDRGITRLASRFYLPR